MCKTLLIGGARSGKSARALMLGQSLGQSLDRSPGQSPDKPPGERLVFVATAEALDSEMEDRIARHKADRAGQWETLEAPVKLVSALSEAAALGDVCVVDCLTLWLSNLMHHGCDIEQETERLEQAVSLFPGHLVLVSNELGLGLVPETALGRRFRDAQGRLNQRLALICSRVEFIAAGLPLVLKG